MLTNLVSRVAFAFPLAAALVACASSAEPQPGTSDVALQHLAYTIDHSPAGGSVEEEAACESRCCVNGPTTGVRYCCDWSGGGVTCGYSQ